MVCSRCFPLGRMLWFCLYLGGVAWGQPAPEKPPGENSFPRPVWHPDARWQVEKFAGTGARGHLDGPRLEIEDYCNGRPMARVFQPLGAGRYQYSGLDPLSGRVHRVSGGARGTLDGPLSRARFGGWDYVARNHLARSPDGRYLYILEGYNRHRLRYIDLQQQWVGTLFPRLTQLRGIAVGDDGTIYLVQHPQQLWTISPDHQKLRRGPRLQISRPANAWGYSLAVDQQRGRLYATKYRTPDYYIWYWDLSTGQYHGVLPTPKTSGKDRGRNVPGPFEGTNLYEQGVVLFGPDDPDKRFLYTPRTDTFQLIRLDLQRRMVAILASEKGPDGSRWWKFSDEPHRPQRVPLYGNMHWLPDGSFLSGTHSPWHSYLFRRVR